MDLPCPLPYLAKHLPMQFLQVVDGKHVRDSRPRGSERPLLAAHNVWTLDGAKLRSGLHQWKPNLLQVLFGERCLADNGFADQRHNISGFLSSSRASSSTCRSICTFVSACSSSAIDLATGAMRCRATSRARAATVSRRFLRGTIA